MCIGVPMQVVESHSGFALCEAEGERHHIDTLLVGDQPKGTWLLTFLGGAREVLGAEQAVQIQAALQAVQLAMRGQADIDSLFPDLAERTPELPGFLRSPSE